MYVCVHVIFAAGKFRISSKLRNLSVVVLVEAAIRKGPVVHDAKDDSDLRERAGTRAPSNPWNNRKTHSTSNLKPQLPT